MIDQTMLAEAQAQDVSADLHQRIRAFTAFYEQHAYLAYNLALRVTCEVEPAMRAVQAAFLSQLDDRPKGLVAATVEAALYEASAHPEPAGAGDREAEALMGAIVGLPAPERAALALADLAHAGPAGIGAALGLGDNRAGKLLHRAREGFGARLGLPRPEADAASRDWMWAPPPNAIWEELYPGFHRSAERQARRGRAANTLTLGSDLTGEQVAAPAARRRQLHVPRPLRRGWRRALRRWTVVVPAVLILGLAGTAAARLLNGTGATRHATESQPGSAAGAPGSVQTSHSAGPGAVGPATPHKVLTPAELDRLRLRELQQLNAYTKRQADKRLSPVERKSAAQGIANLQRAADERLQAELKREAALREQLARAHAKANAPPPPPPSNSSKPTRRPQRPSSTQQTTTPSNSQPSQQQVKKTCLFDQDTGQYVCPQ
jgi:hypothetical protein